jgi:hypothetical protein
MTSAESSCSVCGEGLTEATGALCHGCGYAFHLNQRTDVPGKDCGDVWINEVHLGLEFACNGCLEPGAGLSLDDVIDLDEAAAACAVSAGELAKAAEAGELAHRKTAGGVYLFERRALSAFGRRQIEP